MDSGKILSGVIRGVLPYAAIGGVGFLGYMWLKKNGVLNGIGDAVNTVFQLPQTIVGKTSEIVTGTTEAIQDVVTGNANEDTWRETPLKYVPAVVVRNAAADTDESIWRDSPAKYVPAVAIRNKLVDVFGRN